MEYTRSVGDVYETFEGTSDEILALLQLLEGLEDEFLYSKSNTEKPNGIAKAERTIDGYEMIDYIYTKLLHYNIPRNIIKEVLDARMEYLKSKNIAK